MMKTHFAFKIHKGTLDGGNVASKRCNSDRCSTYYIDTPFARKVNHLTTDPKEVTCGNCKRLMEGDGKR